MTSNWMKENVIDKGVENVRFFAKMGQISSILPWGMAVVSGNRDTWVECKVDENRYKIDEGYKITLVSLDERCTYEHYYQSDFESLIEEGQILVKNNELEHVEHIQWLETLYGDVYVVHEADMVV